MIGENKMLDRYKYSDAEMKELLSSITVVIDRREKVADHIKSYFDKHKIPYIDKSLSAFDYTFFLPKNEKLGIMKDLYFDKDILFERKASLEELSSNLTKNRTRFEEEMCTAKALYKYLIIENANYFDVVNGNYKSEYNSKSYVGTLHSFNNKYDLQIVFMPDKTYTPIYMYATMQYYLRNILK